MTARQKVPRKRQPGAPKAESPLAPQRRRSSVGVETAINECIVAISLVEVTWHSLDSQDIASPEQEVLRHALTVMWAIHDLLSELESEEPDGHLDGEDKP